MTPQFSSKMNFSFWLSCGLSFFILRRGTTCLLCRAAFSPTQTWAARTLGSQRDLSAFSAFFFFFQAAVKSMQHASRSLCTFICIPAVCPSLHSANARLLIMFQNPKAFGKALITPKAHKPLFDLFFSYVTFSIALFFFCPLLHAAMMYSVENWDCEVEGVSL